MSVVGVEMFRFASGGWLLLLWLLPLLVGLVGLSWWFGRASLRRFVDPALLPLMNRGSSVARRGVKLGLVFVSLVLVGVAMARPQWDPEPVEVAATGRDVCFVIDVSRSMLAQDGPAGFGDRPTRLDRAKLWMKDVSEVLRGDRVSLVAFAGNAIVKCPLTNDYGFFRLAVDALDTKSVSKGGTMIGDALRVALGEALGAEGGDGAASGRYMDVILITDGEDQGSVPIAAAERAGELGVRIIAIGIGSPEGERIRFVDDEGRARFVTDANGRAVTSRLDSETLQRMALATTDGSYLEVADGTIELDHVYESLVRSAKQNERAASEVTRYREGFQVFLVSALVLLFIESLIGERRRRES